MKGLTIHAPWAWAIAAGHKKTENRRWRPRHRGPLAIVAGLSQTSDAEASTVFAANAIAPPPEFVRGAVVAVVDLVDVRAYAKSRTLFEGVEDLEGDPFAEGPWCLQLANVRQLSTPVACSGFLSIVDLPAAVAAAVESELNTGGTT